MSLSAQSVIHMSFPGTNIHDDTHKHGVCLCDAPVRSSLRPRRSGSASVSTRADRLCQKCPWNLVELLYIIGTRQSYNNCINPSDLKYCKLPRTYLLFARSTHTHKNTHTQLDIHMCINTQPNTTSKDSSKRYVEQHCRCDWMIKKGKRKYI